jgi:hypothetical protein
MSQDPTFACQRKLLADRGGQHHSRDHHDVWQQTQLATDMLRRVAARLPRLPVAIQVGQQVLLCGPGRGGLRDAVRSRLGAGAVLCQTETPTHWALVLKAGHVRELVRTIAWGLYPGSEYPNLCAEALAAEAECVALLNAPVFPVPVTTDCESETDTEPVADE